MFPACFSSVFGLHQHVKEVPGCSADQFCNVLSLTLFVRTSFGNELVLYSEWTETVELQDK